MKIALCIKQVPDTSDIKWTEHNTIQRDGVESIINPYDVYAIEAALQIKRDCTDVEITAITMGPPQADEMLRKAIAVGVDKGALITDRKFAGADTYATGKTLAQAIKTVVADFDIVICGQFAVDGDTAQTGPSIANHLDIPQVTYVKNILKCDADHIVLTRLLDDGLETVKAKLPVLLCVLQGDETPHRATIDGVIRAQKADVKVYGMTDLGLESEDVGLKGSPTYVSKAFRPIVEHECEKIHHCDEICDIICDKIKSFGINTSGGAEND